MADVNERGTELSPKLLEKARVELREIQSQVPGHIKALKERILEDTTTNFRTDDAFLLRFLRARKFDQERAFELMSKFYRQRQDYPNLFNKTKSECEKILDPQILGILPNRDADGRAILASFAERWNTAEISFDDIMFNFFVSLEILVEDEAVQINGAVWIFHMSGFNLSHAAQMTPWKVKQAVTVLLNTFPMRVKGIHYVYESPIFDGIYLIIRPFLSKKLQERIVFHGNVLASLHEQVSPEILPEELDGDLDPVDFSEWNERLLQNFGRFVEDFKYGFVLQE